MTGLTTGVTTIHRKNLATLVFEPAGSIEWASDTNATVYFGLEEVSDHCSRIVPLFTTWNFM
jgi:hypothetical protein